jgi:hypothetical protein
MPEMTLHVLNGRVILHVRGRGATKRLMGHIANPGFLGQWFQVSLQIIAYAECCSLRAREQERARIVAIWMPRNPYLDLPFQIRR